MCFDCGLPPSGKRNLIASNHHVHKHHDRHDHHHHHHRRSRRSRALVTDHCCQCCLWTALDSSNTRCLTRALPIASSSLASCSSGSCGHAILDLPSSSAPSKLMCATIVWTGFFSASRLGMFLRCHRIVRNLPYSHHYSTGFSVG